ncbi:hypothetical protein YYE_04750 [Plasmodium vinckei vinckei]|uniref:Uncharacterized protein n=1 Tax=Plasmodium vinckei vinckei TaxID=54757 RepID=A0A081IA58_PLAVN|nr:hypothetical protein YYE_04750 [Plasmodium vinckei vinckei]
MVSFKTMKQGKISIKYSVVLYSDIEGRNNDNNKNYKTIYYNSINNLNKNIYVICLGSKLNWSSNIHIQTKINAEKINIFYEITLLKKQQSIWFSLGLNL